MNLRKITKIIALFTFILLSAGCLNKSSNINLENTDNTDSLLKRVISVDPNNCGNIEGTVIDPEGYEVEEAFVYVKQGSDYVDSIGVTDEYGYFSMDIPEGNSYTLHIIKNEIVDFDGQTMENEFYSELVSDITVTVNNITDLGDIQITEAEDERYSSITGSVYYDTQNTLPLQGAVILAYKVIDLQNEEIEPADFYAGVTDSNGNFKINFVQQGNYIVYILKGENHNEQEIFFSISSQDIYNRTIKDIGQFTLVNHDPQIQQGDETIYGTYPMDEEEPIELRVDVTDLDGDDLQYTWSTSGGIIDISDDNTNRWLGFSQGTYYIKVKVSDKKGGIAQKIWTVNL